MERAGPINRLLCKNDKVVHNFLKAGLQKSLNGMGAGSHSNWINRLADQGIIKVITYQYNAQAQANKWIYTNDDEILAYGNQGILDPGEVSYYNLYINGVLQPPVNYEIEKGRLILKTQDLPLVGSPIIISFVTLLGNGSTPLNRAQATGHTPKGSITWGPVEDIKIDYGASKQYLTVENEVLSGPDIIYSGQQALWHYQIKITNNGPLPINNITVTDSILLDELTQLEVSPQSAGEVDMNGPSLTWKIDALAPEASMTLTMTISGVFRASGLRFLNRVIAMGNDSTGHLRSQAVSGRAIEVLKGLHLSQSITDGPLVIGRGGSAHWRIEMMLYNESNQEVTEAIVRNCLLASRVEQIKIISASQGRASLIDKAIEWRAGPLKAREAVFLVFDIVASFEGEGAERLSIAEAVGKIDSIEINGGPSSDINIKVLPKRDSCPPPLNLEKRIIVEPLTAFRGEVKSWRFSIKITNLTESTIENVIVTDYILLDEIKKIIPLSNIPGKYTLLEDQIIWQLDFLSPGKSMVAVFEVTGAFQWTGLRSLSRALGVGRRLKGEVCWLSNVASGPNIRVLDFIKDQKPACVSLKKVFSQCKQRNCFEDVSIDLGNHEFERIQFQPGHIVKGSLTICSLAHRPDFKRITFHLRIPFSVFTRDGTIISGNLPDLLKNVVVFIPQTRDELTLDIMVETNTVSLGKPSVQTGQLRLSAGISSVIKVIGLMDMLIPSFDLNYIPGPCEDYIEYKPCRKLNYCRPALGQHCDTQLGNLIIEKYILDGPLRIQPQGLYTWNIQIKVTNNGFGPVSNIQLTDSLLIDQISQIQISSTSQGKATHRGRQIIWQIGTLSAGEMVVLTATIWGTFTNPYEVLNFQYNTVSKGLKRVFTDEDEIKVYGSTGIPDPEQVSFFNLFINGVLQPHSNYAVQEGQLTLTTEDIPPEGAPIILESLVIKDCSGGLIKATDLLYSSLASGRTYTAQDGIPLYGEAVIPTPTQTSYQQLFINGVLQPPVNYLIEQNVLTLTTVDLPLKDSPITLQSIILIIKES
ncbi:DUF4183 domain-containing protein [Alkaliphilus crotonatoxidans]